MSQSAPESTLPVAVCQMQATGDPAANLSTIERLVQRARAQGARLAVLPEAALLPITSDAPALASYAAQAAETHAALSEIAARADIAVLAGSFQSSEDPAKVFNVLVGYRRDGTPLGSYRKIHLYDAFGVKESDRFAPGPVAPLTFELGGFTLGVLTCYDLRFPELARLLVDAGADALLIPAAWVAGPLKEDHWKVLLRARAIENTVYVVAAGQCGNGCVGLSAVIDPLGVELAGLAEAEGVATAEMARERLQDVRRRLPSLANRRIAVTAGGTAHDG